MRCVHVYIKGRVQGVFFRAATQQEAEDLNLTGWVRNMPDGRVEAVFQGEDKNVDKMLRWCHSGPPAARVEEVLASEEPCQNEFNDFTVRR